jgi:WD40 repeat protein
MAALVVGGLPADWIPAEETKAGEETAPRLAFTCDGADNDAFSHTICSYQPSTSAAPRLVARWRQEYDSYVAGRPPTDQQAGDDTQPRGLHETGVLGVWDTQTGRCLSALQAPPSPEGPRHVVSLCPFEIGGRPRIAAGMEGFLCVYDGDDFAVLHTIRTLRPEMQISCLAAFTEPGDGRTRLVMGASAGEVMLFDAESGAFLSSLKNTRGGLAAMALIPAADGQGARLVLSSRLTEVKVHDLESGTVVHTLMGHVRRVSVLLPSASPRRVVTGSWDGTAKVFDVDTGAIVADLVGHTGMIIDLVVWNAPEDGAARISTSGNDHTVRVGAYFCTLYY